MTLRFGTTGLAICLLPLVGCSPPTLDGSSEEAFQTSREEVRQALPEERRARFDTALMVLAMEGLDFASHLGGAADPERFLLQRLEALDGFSADHVLSRADSIETRRREEMRVSALEEIGELEAKQLAAEAAAETLARFEVTRSRLETREGLVSPSITVVLDVTNGLDVPVSRAYFVGTYQSPDRSIPWFVEDFNYSIPGGLEPGESTSWRLSPNAYSGDWDNAARADRGAVLTVDVVRLDGADGEPVADGEFSEQDRKRLEELRNSISG